MNSVLSSPPRLSFKSNPKSKKENSTLYLTAQFGKGFSVGNLKNIREFYRVYAHDQIGETVFSQFRIRNSTGDKYYENTVQTSEISGRRRKSCSGCFRRTALSHTNLHDGQRFGVYPAKPDGRTGLHWLEQPENRSGAV